MEIVIDRIERLGTSYYGNPYFKVWAVNPEDNSCILSNAYRTSIDAGVNYEINNFGRGDKVKVKLTRAGRIYAIEKV